jgi:hypothetical protein
MVLPAERKLSLGGLHVGAEDRAGDVREPSFGGRKPGTLALKPPQPPAPTALRSPFFVCGACLNQSPNRVEKEPSRGFGASTRGPVPAAGPSTNINIHFWQSQVRPVVSLWLIVRISAILCAPSDPALSPADDRMRAARAASMRRILRLNRVDFQIVRQHIWTV